MTVRKSGEAEKGERNAFPAKFVCAKCDGDLLLTYAPTSAAMVAQVVAVECRHCMTTRQSVPLETAAGATQQDHPKGLKTTDPVVLAVIAKFDERSRIGVEKYGTTLARTDLSLIDWLRHALEEQMDNVLYLQRAINELEQGR